MPHVNEFLARDHIATLLEEGRANTLAQSARTARPRTSLRARLAAVLAAAVAPIRLARPPDPGRRLNAEAAD